jgi:two-component system LytT family response regulator
MNTLRTIIVDDENLARRGLSIRLKQMPNIDVVAECANGHEALQAVAEYSPDLLFLDIQMPGMDGFEVIEQLQADNLPMVIFVTAFNEYAVEAFRVHAIDYVLKPIDDERLLESIERAVAHRSMAETEQAKEKLVRMVMGMTGASASTVEEMADTGEAPRSRPERLTIKDGSEIHLVRVDDIQWVDAAGDYMCIHAGGDTHIMRITMKQLEAMLDPATFLRIHRSTLVNANRVTGAQTLDNGEYLLTLDSDAKLKVSRGYRDKVRHLLRA